ncbi:MAG TPA: GNAT family N-acetyltransferase [Geopsychrobacteraceae bacterium]|nr:GNAT family N-acetyltransferase [Geopsychrobacteraceae bacterium]
MEIRTATPSDWPRIIEIYNHAVGDGHSTADTEPVSVEGRKEWLNQHTSHRYPIRLAEEEGTVVGWCSLSPYRPGRKALSAVAEISYYIARESRGKGCGDKLIKDAISFAENHEFRHLIAILLDINVASLCLLQKFGFQQWGKLPNIVAFEDKTCGQFIYGKSLFSTAGHPSHLAAIL